MKSKDEGNTRTGTVPNQQVHYKLTEVVAQPVYEALEGILDRFSLQGTLSVPEQFTAALNNMSQSSGVLDPQSFQQFTPTGSGSKKLAQTDNSTRKVFHVFLLFSEFS